jgi:hypothetical protein
VCFDNHSNGCTHVWRIRQDISQPAANASINNLSVRPSLTIQRTSGVNTPNFAKPSNVAIGIVSNGFSSNAKNGFSRRCAIPQTRTQAPRRANRAVIHTQRAFGYRCTCAVADAIQRLLTDLKHVRAAVQAKSRCAFFIIPSNFTFQRDSSCVSA